MGDLSKKEEKMYEKYVESVTPKISLVKNMVFAFIFGGAICAFGQFLNNMFMSMGLSKENAGYAGMICLVGISAVLTGLSWYAKLAKIGGAGTLVPITGFANSVASSAIEFLPEGQVFGIGCRIFQIAGPVILYGIFSSYVIGLGYWILKFLEIL